MTDLFRRIQQLFNDIARYLEYNCLVANGMKSKLMMFSSHGVGELPDFVFSGQTIEWANKYKYLGLVLNNKLSYGKHISKVSLNISRISGMLTSVRDILPRCILVKLYQALALPHINLHLEIWGSAPIYLLNTLETKMNNLLRIIFGIYRVNGIPTMGTREMYNANRILRLKNIYQLRLFKFLRALLDGRIPELYDLLLRPYIAHHNYGTRGGQFRHPNMTCEAERRFLSYQLIIMYEQLPDHFFL